MSGSPLDPLVHLATHLAIMTAGMALATLSTVMFLRWLGLHWTWTLPGVLPFPALWSFDQEGAGVIAATALFATVTGARWHHDDLRHGGDGAQDAATPARRSTPPAKGWSAAARAAGAGPTAAAWPSAATSAGAPSAPPSVSAADGTRSWSARRGRARRSRRRGSPEGWSARAMARW